MSININIENKNVIKIFALAVAFMLGVFAFIKMYDALILVLIAFFIALALNPAVSFLSRFMPKKRRGPAILVVFIATFALLFFLLASIIPPIAKETSSFINNLPQTVNKSFYKSENVQNFIKKYSLQDDIDRGIEAGKQRLNQYGSNLLKDAAKFGNSFIASLTVLVMAILMLTGGKTLLDKLANHLYRDQKLRMRHEKLAGRMYDAVTGFVIGQVSVALVASLFALGMLMLLKVPYPLPLAGIVFIFGMIPLIGNTMAAIIVILSTLVLKDVTAGLVLLGFFIVYQQIENITLQPLVQGKTSNLPPLVIFISVILGVGLMGPIGGLFAIPAAGCAKVLLIDYLQHRDDLSGSDSPTKLAEKIKHKLTRKTT